MVMLLARPPSVVLALAASLVIACGSAPDEGQAADVVTPPSSLEDIKTRTDDIQVLDGYKLFHEETFGGNGRVCSTCHTDATGTISPQQIEALYKKNKKDPIFRSIDSDDGVGDSYNRLRKDATVRIEIPLPSDITLAGSSARSVVFNRGIPTTLNTPAFDKVFMYDGRHPDLPSQALGAVHSHTQNTREPTTNELLAIAQFERKTLFSSLALGLYAYGGPAPKLPEGRTASEKRGRKMFDNVPVSSTSTAGICANCHSGAMLNEANEFNMFGAPPGSHFFGIDVSELNVANNPVYTFEVHNPDGTIDIVKSPDPGAMLTRPIPEVPPFFPAAFSANAFKVPSLWSVERTAPYFHDNSAKTLRDVAVQYQKFFARVLGLQLTDQDIEDMIAYVKLL